MKRLLDIDACKGFAIFLVVLGHVGARSVPPDAFLYEWLRSFIYLFHMPFFMFLSGFVFFLTFKPISSIPTWLNYSKEKFYRLFPAYFLLAVVVLLGKLAAQNFVHVDNPATGFYDLVNIMLFPMESVSAFVWYIYVLFWMIVISAFMISILSISLNALLLVSALLIFVPSVSFLGLGQFTKLYFFFVLGCFAVARRDAYEGLVDKHWRLALVGMLVLVLCWAFMREWRILWLPVSLLSIVGIHGMLRANTANNEIWIVLGVYSFSIYLFNTICIGLGKAGLVFFIPMQEYWYSAVYVPLLTLLGIVIPILLKKYLFPYWPWLNRITS